MKSTSPLHISRLAAFNDNYLWLIHDAQNAVVIDPGDAEVVLAACAAHKLTLRAALITHHHPDHIGGLATLTQAFPKLQVFAPALEHIACSHAIDVGDTTPLALNKPKLTVQVLHCPGHTAGHLAYVMVIDGQTRLFCGDTLFALGCGRLFEGTAAQMYTSLQQLAALPDDTLVYCAHEYTASNYRFAIAAEPDSTALRARGESIATMRAQGLPTVPFLLVDEKTSNPFLRSAQASVQSNLAKLGKLERVNVDDAVSAFAALRLWKNSV